MLTSKVICLAAFQELPDDIGGQPGNEFDVRQLGAGDEAEGLLCAGTVLSTFTLTPNYSLTPSKGTAIVLL